MNLLYRGIYILNIILLSSYSLIAQEQVTKEYVHTNFTTQDGLPSNETYCVFQDSKGYIWIGTDRGVVQYDGYEFKTYTEEDGLTDHAIFDIAEDSKGNVWFTTSNSTLCYYNHRNGIHAFEYNDNLQDVIDQRKPYYRPLLDEISITSNDTLYVSHRHWGYIKIPLDSPLEMKNYLYSYLETISDEINLDLVQGNEYQILFITGCLKRNEYNMFRINKGKQKNVWIEAFDVQDRPYVVDRQTFLFGNTMFEVSQGEINYTWYPNSMHVFKFADEFIVNQMIEERKGPVLLSTDKNNLLDGTMVLNVPVRLTQGIKDNNGGIWLSTLEKGIFYIPDLNNQIIKKGISVTGLIPYGDNVIIAERLSNRIYNRKEESLETLKGGLKAGLISNFNKHSIKFYHQVSLKEVNNWIDRFDSKLSKLHSGVMINNDSAFYLMGNGFHKYIKGDDVKILHVFKKRIYSFEFVEQEGYFFLGCENGVYKHFKRDEPNDNRSYIYDISAPFLSLDTKPRDMKWFKRNEVLAIATTGKGMYFYKGQQLLKKITFDDGLNSNSVNQLYLDKNERLWVGTNKGINYIEIDENDSIHVNNYMASSRNLLSPNVQQIYGFNDSILLIGTDQGLNEIKIDLEGKKKKREFPIFITRTFVNKLSRSLEELNYDENNIELEYTAIEFNKYGDIDYRYRLRGLSDDWIYTKERKASFLNLSPGAYAFELEAQDERGEWDSFEKNIKFRIHTPYWESWWFRVLILGILGYVIYYYISKLKQEQRFLKQEKELLEDKQKLSEELNASQQKALSSQLNPHFVFNSLNSIQNFILTQRTELSSDYLSMFSKLMRYIFENSKKIYVSLDDEIEALRLYLELEQVRHNNKFQYQIDSGDLNTQDYLIPALLIQPIIENAIWHGLLHKEIDDRLLEITFSIDGTYLQIEVKDNGVGRGGSKPRKKFIKKQRSSGVELTQQRLKLLSQSTGLDTYFEIIDLVDENKVPKGTQVNILIPVNLSEQTTDFPENRIDENKKRV